MDITVMPLRDEVVHHTSHIFHLICRNVIEEGTPRRKGQPCGAKITFEFSTIGDGPDMSGNVQVQCPACGSAAIVEMHTNPPSARIVP